MENKTIITMGIILTMIAGFTTIVVLDDNGNELMPSHYCESLEIKMYCAKTTTQYCYPKLITRKGSKKCSEGWKEIILQTQTGLGLKYVCNNNECVVS